MENVITLPERPEPPQHFNDEESQVWRDVVCTKPADWFQRDSHPVLGAYCQAVVMHRQLMKRWHKDIDKDLISKDLVGMVNKTANQIAQIATKLRLTQQSRYTPQSANTASKRSKPSRPWESATSDTR